ncbi:DNA translocase FtsK [Ehrlichia ruminantium]|uniref:FtsK/SpoIIIE family DNA translocase n=1 Tax=Ehrlichia ruminantium TaxID=779 RepID=UPI0007A0016B|nr:DNA translocase FtsK 4TM domain-containing protein [Ehrlichia ruminantium]KYX00609.1 cell division protein FtsK [Ehrlichia ruminantium]QLK50287.1 DNA translocase FtsK [Ehrlichia ruminantium]QLK51211.1 DNA translocase FtsK [Ehrlichia ruminantium]QLK58548.1 DNA translocase FtsK [Ehrlichia ruminantium]
MRLTFNKFIFFFRASLLSFIAIFLFLSFITYSSEDLSFNVATNASVKNLCGIIGSHMADIFLQSLGVSSFIIVLLIVLPILFRRNIYLYLLYGCSIVIGISGITSNISFKFMDRYYQGGVLGIFVQKLPVSVLCCVTIFGFIGIIGWKRVIMYFYNTMLVVYYKIISRLNNNDTTIPVAAILYDADQLQNSYNVEHVKLRDQDLGNEGLANESRLSEGLTNEGLEQGLKNELFVVNEDLLDKELETGDFVDKDLSDQDFEDESFADEDLSGQDFEDESFADEDLSDQDFEDESFIDEDLSDQDFEDDGFTDEDLLHQRLNDEEVVCPHVGDANLVKEEIHVSRHDKEVVSSSNVNMVNRRPSSYKFELPSIEYLAKPVSVSGKKYCPDDSTAILLSKVLKDFSIHGRIVNIRYGPVVTLYEFEPSAGTKSSRVIGLSDDIARSMSALSARISVIPGRNVMGIELPNHYREIVMLRDLLESNQYKDSNLKLPIALGKGIDGEVIIADLVKMPHLLIAGTTGSGKSVAINTMILSLVYSLSPDQCKMIMIDPKVLELSVYNSIPHLLTPVVTEPKKAVAALKWVVSEMESRYRLMSDIGARNIIGYNDKINEAISQNRPLEKILQTGFDKETGEAVFEKRLVELRLFPYIVVIVDEMADLMLVAGKEIESSIQRLSQMARAAGIHIIMATQRPSVDVITGVIKANFPTRISFAVTSKIDSRTILGEQGAEQLLGMGDMLYMVSGGKIIRVHGAFVSDDEVQNIVAYLKSQGIPEYVDGITQIQQDYEDIIDDSGFDRDDDLYRQAVLIVMRDRKASISYIQRQLRIGYNRAANLVERMERDGVIGVASTGKREILLD